LNAALVGLAVERDQVNQAFGRQIEIDDPHPAALALPIAFPSDLSRAVRPGMTSPASGFSAIQLMKRKRSSSDHIASARFWKVGVSMTVLTPTDCTGCP
jgi:hypothetical protein